MSSNPQLEPYRKTCCCDALTRPHYVDRSVRLVVRGTSTQATIHIVATPRTTGRAVAPANSRWSRSASRPARNWRSLSWVLHSDANHIGAGNGRVL